MKLLLALVFSLITFTTGEGAQPSVNFTDKIVAATLILEAGGEYHEGAMESVNEVIVNRSQKRKISTWKVCLQKWQFSCWNGIEVIHGVEKAMKHPRWDLALSIATSPTTNYTKGADHYHADYIKDPFWAKSMTITTKVGRHIFYK